MLVGNPENWVKRLRRADDLFLARIVDLWPRCVAKLPADSNEDTITANLVDIVSKDSEVSRRFYVSYQHEPFGHTAEGIAFSKGRIDMALILDMDRERYVAYECKRLNVARKGTINSLAGRYVTEGITRFVTEKYAASIPVGCMLGYVMDGKVDAARDRIRGAITSHSNKIGLLWGPNDDPRLDHIERFVSGHSRVPSGTAIEIRHALLPFQYGVHQVCQ